MVGSEGSNSSSPRKYGITKPISLAGPTDADLQRNSELEKLSIELGLYESKEEAEKRVAVLEQIGEMSKNVLHAFYYVEESLKEWRNCLV
ncbi:hypothetical protein Dimus_010547 [Dionaea muscipula]